MADHDVEPWHGKATQTDFSDRPITQTDFSDRPITQTPDIDIVIIDYSGKGGLPLSPSRVARAIDTTALGREVRTVVVVNSTTGLTANYQTTETANWGKG